MVKVHMNNKGDVYIPVCVHALCTVQAQVSSPPDASPVDHKNEKVIGHHQSVRVGMSGKFLHHFMPR